MPMAASAKMVAAVVMPTRPASVFQNRAGAEKADALNDVGRDARRTGIAIDAADFD